MSRFAQRTRFGLQQAFIYLAAACVLALMGNGLAPSAQGGGGQPTVQFVPPGQYLAFPGTFTLDITLSAPSSDVVTVQWATADGMATSPQNYQAASGTAVFAPGSVQEQIQITIIGNGGMPDPYFAIGLTNPENASLAWPMGASVTIGYPPPPPPTVQFSNANYYCSERSGTATITATLSSASSGTVTVNYATSNGTATAGLDYDATSGTLAFAPGETTKTFTITIIPDLLAEGDETVNLALSNVSSSATYGTNQTAILNIWDCPPVLTVTAATNPICAGALPTAVHQTAINVSLTNGAGPFVGISLTLLTSAGSLSTATGTTDSSGSFTTTLTSNHWASGTSYPYTATVTVVADGVMTQTTQVTFNPTVVALSSDVKTIPTAGVANLTVALTFQSQTVAGHRLHWSIAAIWDHSGNMVYNGTGAIPTGYGHIDAGASRTTNSSGAGSAVYQSGYKKGKVEIAVNDKSVKIAPGGANPNGQVVLQDKKLELKIQVLVGDKYEDLTGNNRRFLVGEQVNLIVRSNATITEYKWMPDGKVFESYDVVRGDEKKEPSGKFKPVTDNAVKIKLCWYGTEDGRKNVTCKVKINGVWQDASNFLEIFRPKAKLTVRFGEMAMFLPRQTDDGRLWKFGLFNVERPFPTMPNIQLVKIDGIKIDASAKMPIGFGNAKNRWSFVQTVNHGLTLVDDKKKTASPHSIYGQKKTQNGKWVLDGHFPYYYAYFKLDQQTGDLEWSETLDPVTGLYRTTPREPSFFADTPEYRWLTKFKAPDDPSKGIKMGSLAEYGLGNLAKCEFKDQEFKTYLMFESQRPAITSFPVPIVKYSVWKMNGVVEWDNKLSTYSMVKSAVGAVAGSAGVPTAFEPEWTDSSLYAKLEPD